MSFLVKFSVGIVVHFETADSITEKHAATVRIAECELVESGIPPCFLTGNHSELCEQGGSLYESMVEKVGGIVIFDLAGNPAGERRGIEAGNGGDAANSFFNGLPKRLNSDADRADDSDSCNCDAAHSEIPF